MPTSDHTFSWIQFAFTICWWFPIRVVIRLHWYQNCSKETIGNLGHTTYMYMSASLVWVYFASLLPLIGVPHVASQFACLFVCLFSIVRLFFSASQMSPYMCITSSNICFVDWVFFVALCGVLEMGKTNLRLSLVPISYCVWGQSELFSVWSDQSPQCLLYVMDQKCSCIAQSVKKLYLCVISQPDFYSHSVSICIMGLLD